MKSVLKIHPAFSAMLAASALFAEATWSQIPDAPPIPVCSWDSTASPLVSTCKFKEAMSGTPTSVVGNRVVLYTRATSGGEANARKNSADALKRLATRYGFTAMITDSPSIFTAANLSSTKVVIMSNGDGDVVPVGPYRDTLNDFQMINGWGVLWIHAACNFISSGWPFGQQNCVQSYFRGNPSGTVRRMFLDSGTAADPNHGIRNPQSEFLLRSLPGWGANRTLGMTDRWYCFREPARNTPGVNVLFGYDRSSGLPNGDCQQAQDKSEGASQNHNMAWTHAMGKGISIYNSWGQDVGAYTANGHMGDSLLWRYIRYAAKDWCVSGSGEPGCDGPISILRKSGSGGKVFADGTRSSLTLENAGLHYITVHDLSGKKIHSASLHGPGKFAIPGMHNGIHFVQWTSAQGTGAERILLP